MFKPTSDVLLKLNRLIKSDRLKFFGAFIADIIHVRHQIVRMDTVDVCNLRCAMCYFSDDDWLKNNSGKRLTEEEVERLAEMFFPSALQVHVGCSAEPTMNKNFVNHVRLAKKKFKVPFVGMVTNGQLLTKEKIEELIDVGLDEITLSAHGVTKPTFEKLMQRASFERFHETLKMLDDAKKAKGVDYPKLRINYTVNPDNLDELAEFFNVFGKYNIHTLQVRPIVDLGDTDFKNKNFHPHLVRYNKAIEVLARKAKENKIIVLANTIDPEYSQENPESIFYETAIQRYLGPSRVWKTSFDWRHISYNNFKKSEGYRWELLKIVFRGSKQLQRASPFASSELL
jgi:molybdenum cofactor biosynthesis enzyme MoaA